MTESLRKYWDLVLGTALVAFACWLVYYDIRPDGAIGATTAIVAGGAFLAGGIFIDPVKIKEVVTLWLSLRSNKPQP